MKIASLRTAVLMTGIACLSAGSVAHAGDNFSESDAAKIADATQAAWITMDVTRLEAPYSKNVVVFDPLSKVLVTDWAGFHKIQESFAQVKMDAMTVPDRKIQVLNDTTFIVSGTGQGTSTTGRQKKFQLRFTDVYHRQPDGVWLIVNEHISLVPRR